MPVPALIVAILAAAAPASAAANADILVTGHAWAPFISPMGEPFRARTRSDDTLAKWFGQADRNRDGWLTADEMQADAERFFATLDTDGNGRVGPEEVVQYEWEVAPDIQLSSKQQKLPGDTPASPRPVNAGDAPGVIERALATNRRREPDNGLQGAARYALLNLPEPVAAADLNFDRDVSLAEFRQAALTRFQLLDSSAAGRLALAPLEQRRLAAQKAGRGHRHRDKDNDVRVGNPLPPGN